MSSNEEMFLVIIGDEDYQVPDDLKEVVEQSDSNMEIGEIIEEQQIEEEPCTYEIQVENEDDLNGEENVNEEGYNFDGDVVDEGVIVEEPGYEEPEKTDGVNGDIINERIILDQPYEVELEEMKEDENNSTNNQEIIIEGLDENSILQLQNGELQLEDGDGQHYLIQEENGQYVLQESSKYNIVEINGEQVLVQEVEETDEHTNKNNSNVQYVIQQDTQGSSDDEFARPKRKQERPPRPHQVSSYVQELKETYPELNDEERLISTLAEIMRTIKPPPLPDNFCVMNGIMFECNSCGKFFNSMPEAARHFQYYHGERYLICFACGADFRNPTNLYKHEKGCTMYPDIISVLKARSRHLSSKGRNRPYFSKSHEIRIENNRFLCSQCPASFGTRSGLDAHEHEHAGDRPYLCAFCVCAYTSPSALSRHMRKHRGEMLVCEQCGKRLSTRNALDAHMLTHQPALRRYLCPECPKRFSQKSSLQLHLERLHRDLPPPCACQLCPARYPRMSQLRQHMKEVHGMLLMTQKMFYKSLPRLTPSQVEQAKVVLKSEVEKYPRYVIEKSL
ncbi:zinc finger protein 436 isoform X1 [Pieris rapae]|uniref:zinc finger protein 436 isoform X1 n=1 Tax=Pieris rapae TaxID=64459 RepID=UPI001E27DDFA|nr:zinc finger protein 436 isoform X1 [Pieris rapae]